MMKKEKNRSVKIIAVIASIVIIGGLVFAGNYDVVTEWIIGNRVPSIDLDDPADDSLLSSSTIQFNWTSSDGDPDDVLDHIWYADVTNTFSSPLLKQVDVDEDQTYTPPSFADGEWFWRVSVTDSKETNVSSTFNFTLKTNLSNHFPELSSPQVNPTSGNIGTNFVYSVVLTDLDNTTPIFIYVNIDGTNHSMSESDPSDTNLSDGKTYHFTTTLTQGNDHEYSFIASDSDAITATDIYDNPDVSYVGLSIPTQSDEQPANRSTQITLPLSAFNITIHDADGQPMNISLRTNFSGAWVTFNESNGLANGTYSFTNTSWISGLGQRVFWSVNLTDGIYWVNRSYWFVTENLDVAVIYPEDGGLGTPQPYLTFSLSNPLGNPMNYTIYVGNSSENTTIEIANASGVANGTYHDLHYLATNNTQTYYWRVYVNDGILFTNETFSFSLTSGAGGMISMGNSFALVLALGGWIFGIGGILLAVFILTSKKGKRRKK
jgi:hypothetical protein